MRKAVNKLFTRIYSTKFIPFKVSLNFLPNLRFAKFFIQSVVAGLAGAFVLLYLYPGLYSAQNGNPAMQDQEGVVSYSDAVNAVAPAVVNVYATQIERSTIHPLFQDPLFRRFFGQRLPAERRNNLGSGVVMDARGYLLTNAHVIRNADEILVTLYDGRQGSAEVVGMDVDTDLAVLKIAMADLQVAPTSDSSRVKVGDVVLAIGNPYDFGQTVTQGIVSATGRNRVGITTLVNYIQTDADINPGNSGGALVSAVGKLIGINTAIISSSGGSQGIGLAIPTNLALDVLQQIIEYGHVIRGWIGIEAQIVPQDIRDAAGLDESGILIAAVLNGSPAALAGVKPGDIMTSIDGNPLYDPRYTINMISRMKPGDRIEIELLRGWKTEKVEALVAERPAPKQ